MQSTPSNLGYKLPDILPQASPSAPVVRTSAVTANLGSYELPTQPRLIVDQQAIQCCVSCALAGTMEILFRDWPALSPLFHYYVTRYDDGGANPDGTLLLSSGLSALEQQGICLSNLHSPPYTLAGAGQSPSPDARSDAGSRILSRQGLFSRYQKVGGPSLVANIRDVLNRNSPVVLAFQLPMGYKDSFPTGNMIWTDPDSPGRSASFHCVLVTGYDDARRALHIHDSQGMEHFDQGRWWMGYRVVDSSVVAEAYSFT